MRHLWMIAALALSGCLRPSTFGDPRIADNEVVAQLVEGLSKSEVRDLVGKPASVAFEGEYEQWGYVYAKIEVFKSSPSHTLTIQFGDDGRLKKVGRGEMASSYAADPPKKSKPAEADEEAARPDE